MPRGFMKPVKVLKIIRSLYGLKQILCKFFQHIKSELGLQASNQFITFTIDYLYMTRLFARLMLMKHFSSVQMKI